MAQLIGGLLGALLLLWVCTARRSTSGPGSAWARTATAALSLLHASAGGAFLIEVIITAAFVLVVLSATRKEASAPVAGLIIGFALALVNVMGIPIDGASVNPARSFGPAIVVGGPWFSQLWLFIIAPLVGGVLAAGLFILFHQVGVPKAVAGAGDVEAEHTMTMSAADEADVVATGPAAATTAAMPPGTSRVVSGTPAAAPAPPARSRGRSHLRGRAGLAALPRLADLARLRRRGHRVR